MDYQGMTRKELQALCKEHGIPANKTNVFMAEALAAKRRLPFSTMDTNKLETKVRVAGSRITSVKDKGLLTGSSFPKTAKENGVFKENDVLTGNSFSTKHERCAGSPERKFVAEKVAKHEEVEVPSGKIQFFTNNFLKRGKRKEAHDSPESKAAKPAPTMSGKSNVESSKPIAKETTAVVKKNKCEPTQLSTNEIRVNPLAQSDARVEGVESCKASADMTTAVVTKVRWDARQSSTTGIDLNTGAPSDTRLEGVESCKASADMTTAVVTKVKWDARQSSTTGIDLNTGAPSDTRVDGVKLDYSFSPLRKASLKGEDLLALVPRFWTTDVGDSPPIRSSPLLEIEERVKRILDRARSFCWKTEAVATSPDDGGSAL